MGFRYPYPKKREVFQSLLESVAKRQIVEIIGLRRVGKTILLFQLINQILEEKTKPFSLWYFTFDEERPKLEELFQDFTKQTQIDIKKERVFIFLDEAQKLPHFQNQLKIYYDLYPNLKFFISGSTSLFIKKKTQESLAGRIISFFLPPLDFGEYLYFKEKKEILEKALIFSKEIEKEFEMFLQSQFIESLGLRQPNEKKRIFYQYCQKDRF